MTTKDPTGSARQSWPKAAASAVVFRDDCVLLVQRGKPPVSGVWSLPGGHIEPGETAREAAQREIKEETGVTMELVGLADVHDAIIRDASGALLAHYLLAVFYGRWLAGEPVAASDCRDARFVPLNDVPRYQLTEGAQRIIETAHQLLQRR